MREQVLELLQRYIDGPFRSLSSGNILVRCPFHKYGRERNPSLSINPDEGLFHCFTGGCIANPGGGLVKLFHLLGVPQAARGLDALLPLLERQRESAKAARENIFKSKDPFLADPILPAGRILGTYAGEPVELTQKGFSRELLAYLRVGYDLRAQRIIYPIWDLYGNLAGVVGGVTSLSPTPIPKYKVYQGACWHQGAFYPGDFGPTFDDEFPGYRFENHKNLWNLPNTLEAIRDGARQVFVTEGYKSGLWVMQAGFPAVVALMGSSLSSTQRMLLHRLDAELILCLDGDEPGEKATKMIGRSLFRELHGMVRKIVYLDKERPQLDNYTLEEAKVLLDNPQRVL